MTTVKPPHLNDAEIERIKRESEERRTREPHAESVTYDARSGTLKVELRGGSVISTRARELRGLSEAADAQLANVRVYDGCALWWDDLDVQYSLIAFLGAALGIPTAQESARRAGSATTPAKAVAARANGKKGGRPKISAG